MKKQNKTIHVAKVGTLSVDLNITTFSNGSGPKVLIISGMHGNEFSGSFVLERLITQLDNVQGEINILSVANPTAFALRKRETPTDNQDLNRVFPGNSAGTLTEQVAIKIFELAKTMDLVIDLHTFEDPCPIVAIFMNVGTEEVREKTANVIKTFNPDVVWKLAFTKDEASLSKALGPKLALDGVVNFAIGMPEFFRITQEQVDRVAKGILDVLQQKSPNNKLNIITRNNCISIDSGIFIANKNLMDTVKKGDVVGTITSLTDFEKKDVLAHEDGMLVILKERDIVATGDRLFSIGIIE
jgi:uncharacterized protein